MNLKNIELTTDKLFNKLCQNNDVRQLQSLFNLDKMSNSPISQESINIAFMEACATHSWDVAKFLIASEDIKIHAELHFKDYLSVKIICISDNIEMIDYFITKSSLSQKINLNQNPIGIINTASTDMLISMKYLLSFIDEGEYKEKVINQSFIAALNNSALTTLESLIFEYNAVPPLTLEEDLKTIEMTEETKKEVLNMLSKRSLFINLNTELNNNVKINKKNKV